MVNPPILTDWIRSQSTSGWGSAALEMPRAALHAQVGFFKLTYPCANSAWCWARSFSRGPYGQTLQGHPGLLCKARLGGSFGQGLQHLAGLPSADVLKDLHGPE